MITQIIWLIEVCCYFLYEYILPGWH